MKKTVKKLILLFIIMILILVTKTYAAGSFSISSSKTTINKGESVTLSIKGNNAYGEVNITATNAKVSPSSVFLQNDTKTVTVTSTSSEDIKVTVSPAASGLGDIDENPIAGSQSTTIKVNETSNVTETSNVKEKSNVAILSNLGIKPNDFSGFKANTFSYNVEVPNETESIEVYASKGQSGQTISGTGKKSLKEGVNTINVVVTAEDGKTKKTYTINVTRKTKEETEENEEKEETEENSEEEPMEEAFGLSELKVEGFELEPQFQTDLYEYKLELKEDLEKLNITTLATKANSNIEITGNENLQEGENVITIIVKGENEAETVAYQIIVNKTLESQEDILGQEQQEKTKKIIILSVAGGVILIIVIAIIIVKIKKSKKSNDGYIPYENLVGDYEDDNEIDEQIIEDIEEDELYKQKPKKKKHSKGKRFK